MNFPTILRGLISNPGNTALHLVQIVLQDSLYAVIFAWFNALQPAALNLQARFVYFAWVLGAAAGGLLGFYSLKSKEIGTGLGDRFHSQALLLGCLGVLSGGLPVWLTDRQIIVGMWSDRFSLAPMVGAALLVVAVIDWFGGDKLRRTLVLSGLAVVAVAFQAQVANRYRINWEIQRAYYWQLSWRAPGFKPGTAVIGPEVPFSYVADMSLGFAYNVLYDSNPGSSPLPIWFFTAGRLWGLEELDRLRSPNPAGLPVNFKLRNVQFVGNTGAAVGIQYNPSRGCLRVADRVYSLAPVLSDDPSSQYERFLYQFSNPDQIQAGISLNSELLTRIFGVEPAHGWCFYYEKADLARQLRDWAEAGRLGDEVIRLGYKPANAVERIPFIEGFVHLGQWERALEWTSAAFQQDARSQAALCQMWARTAQEPGVLGAGAASNWIQRARDGLQCSP